MMDITTVGLVGAVATLVGTVSGFVVAIRRSNSESDDHWQAIMNQQLKAQSARNAGLDKRVAELWEALDKERAERRRIESVMASRIALLESILRSHGIAVPT